MAENPSNGPKRRRRDFEESREMILESAEAEFTERGPGVSMQQLARRAGVVPATLYRHFPNRDTLERAVFERRAETYASAIDRARSVADPADALRGTVHAVTRLQADDRFFSEYIRSAIDDPFADEALLGFYAHLIAVLEAGRAAGVLRDAVELVDVLVLLTVIENSARALNVVSPEGLVRVVDLVLDGLCSERVVPSGEPVTQEQLLEVVRAG